MSTARYTELKAALKGDAPLSGHVSEDAAFPPVPSLQPIDERIVQAIWHEQLLQVEQLKTISGKRVQAVDPGQWNGEAGPDFLSADLQIGEQRVRGDVEIHINASDWQRHQHHRDFAYNRVVLHVV